MKTFIMAAMALAFTAGLASAQAPATAQNISRPTVGMGSKTMASCTADRQKFCGAASDYMAKECLVKNWDVITSDCQDALGDYFDGVSPHHN